jgi:hypothetical protein
MAGSRNDRGRWWRVARATLLTAVLVALLPAWQADAGSIFMKNGYIIQGPVVEYTDGGDGAVVMGWPNGKVTIHRRFIERIDLEPSEEKTVKAAAEAQKPTLVEEIISAPNADEELPQSLNELVKSYVESRSPAGVKPDGGTKPAAGATPGVDVTVVPKPTGDAKPDQPAPGNAGAQPATPAGEDLTEPITNPRWGFSLRPPRGWRISEVEGCVSWSGPPGQDGFSPSINVSSLNSGSLKWEEACTALKEDQAIPFGDYELLTQETLEVSGRPAYRVAGHGDLPGKTPGSERKVSVRQVLIEKGDRLWLISTFTSAAMNDAFVGLLEHSLETLDLQG